MNMSGIDQQKDLGRPRRNDVHCMDTPMRDLSYCQWLCKEIELLVDLVGSPSVDRLVLCKLYRTERSYSICLVQNRGGRSDGLDRELIRLRCERGTFLKGLWRT
jgi:hypothetical protein